MAAHAASVPATDEERQKHLSQLSDNVLYREAVDFARSHELPERKQLMGLLTFSRSWGELLRYVRHQQDRDWLNNDHVKKFYTELLRYLNDPRTGIFQRVRSDLGLVPETTKGEERERWAGMAAREFVQHLIAESWLRTNR